MRQLLTVWQPLSEGSLLGLSTTASQRKAPPTPGKAIAGPEQSPVQISQTAEPGASEELTQAGTGELLKPGSQTGPGLAPGCFSEASGYYLSRCV